MKRESDRIEPVGPITLPFLIGHKLLHFISKVSSLQSDIV